MEDQLFGNADKFKDRFHLLKHALDQSNKLKLDGEWGEFGVNNGVSINFISRFRDKGRCVYGFDSFQGLPEDWVKGKYNIVSKAKFTNASSKCKKNIKLVVGFF